MGRTCAALECSSSDALKKNIPNITFHRFPKDSDLHKKWEDVLNRKAWKANKHPVLCSLHFEPSCFFKTNTGRMQLMPGSVPSIFQPGNTDSSINRNNFTFVGIKSEPIRGEENIMEPEAVNILEDVKEECDEESLHLESPDANFIDVKCEVDTITLNDGQPEVDPLEEQTFVKQEIQETEVEGCLTDYVIPEDQIMSEVKEEDEMIIDDRQIPMDWSEEEEENVVTAATSQPSSAKSKPIKCITCNKTFSQKHLLQEHESVHRDELFACLVCAKKYSRSQLKKHMDEEHRTSVGISQLTCEVCFKKCKTVNSLKNHTLFHKVERKLKCTKCMQTIEWVGSLQRFNMFNNGEKPFLCPACDQITKLKLIEIATTNNRAKPILNLSASKLQANATVTSKTVLQTTNITGPTVSCGICEQKFINYSFLMIHELEHKVEKELLCSSCGTMNNWSGTLGHFNRFSSGEEEFTCIMCSPENELECAVCKKMVHRWNGVLRESMKVVNNVQQNDEQFVCASCNVTNVVSTLPVTTPILRHILPKPSVNNPAGTSVQPCKNICVLCNKTFDTFHKLHNHKETHKVQSQIDCSNCKKVIKWFGSLANLEDFISGKNRIICTECVNSNVSVENVQSQVQYVRYVHANVTCSNCLGSIKWVGSLTQLEKYTSHLEKILCERCENTVRTVNRNIKTEEGRNVQVNIVCSSCKRMFQWSGPFTQLALIMAGTNPKCPVCEKKVAQNSGKKGNMKRKQEKSLCCKICKRRFNKISKMFGICDNKNFIEIDCKCCLNKNEFVCEVCSLMHPQKASTLTCDLCRPIGKLSFPDLSSFLTHIKCHVPIRDFVCTACNQIGYWGNDLDAVDDFKCRRCNHDSSLVEFSKLTKENIIFENKIIDHFNTMPLIEKELECSKCRKLFPWYGNEKQLKEFTSGIKTYICLKCCS